MPASDELDRLPQERFGLGRADLITALKTLPAIRPRTVALSEDQARLLDESGFTEDPRPTTKSPPTPLRTPLC